MNCTYRACPTPPVSRIEPPNGGRSWYACKPHEPAMVKALSLGCASDLGADVVPLTRAGSR